MFSKLRHDKQQQYAHKKKQSIPVLPSSTCPQSVAKVASPPNLSDSDSASSCHRSNQRANRAHRPASLSASPIAEPWIGHDRSDRAIWNGHAPDHVSGLGHDQHHHDHVRCPVDGMRSGRDHRDLDLVIWIF